MLKTVIAPGALPDKLRKPLASLRFPSDLIAPENICVPRSLKLCLGELPIPTVDDATAMRPEFGQPPKTKPATEHGALFVTSPASGKISLLEEGTLTKITDFPTEGTPSGMCYAGNKLYIADQAKSRLLILDPKKRQFLGQIDLPKKSAPKGLAASLDGKLIYCSESATNSIDVIDTDTDKLSLRTKVGAGPARLAMTPNGFTLIVLNVPCGEVSFLSTLNQRLLGSVKVGSMPNAIAVGKDSLKAYVSNRMSNTVSVIDINKRQVVQTLQTGTGPTGICLNGAGTQLLVANAKDNTISIFDLKKGEKIQDVKLPLDVDFPATMTLMPDGKHLVVSSASTDAVGIFDTTKMEFAGQPVIGHPSDEILWVPLD